MSNDITIANASELDTMAKAIIEDIAEPGLALTPELIEEGKHLLEALNLARTGLAESVEKLFETIMPGELVEVNVLGYRRPLGYTRCAIGTKPGDNVAVFHALPTT